MTMDRRAFLGIAACSAAGLASRPSPGTLLAPGEEAAPAAPVSGRRWAMVVDVKRCQERDGCTACIAACHRVHNVPAIDTRAHEVKWIWQEPFERAFPSGRDEHTNISHAGRPVLVFCNHCDRPPCVRVCPVRATWRRDDGVVMMDWHRCIGCRYCVAACPYGSRSFNWLDPRPHVRQLDPGFPTRTKGVVEKCTFCEERISKGQPPACVEACPEAGLAFGDLNEAGSRVRALLASRYSIRRKPELGTRPAIYYLI
ncbi:MAG: 4Fe-4S dicluster domain-containing protein [Acidobacteria bacterium]|nr:4Fe-4S dicluster domain-containing protein [Acidobacteriota bacterium]